MRTRKIIVVAALATILAGHANAAPQDEEGSATSNPDYAPVCMTREEGAPEGARSILVPAINVEAMKAKGFVIDDCTRRFRSVAQRRAWRNRICKYAAEQSEVMQRQYEAQFGERPAVLCGMAEMIIGQWVRGQGDFEGGEQ